MCARTSNALTGPSRVSTNLQRLPTTTPGSAQTNTMTLRTTLVAQLSTLMDNAATVPPTRFTTRATTTSTTVWASASEKSGAPMVARKFLSPAQGHAERMSALETSLKDITMSWYSG